MSKYSPIVRTLGSFALLAGALTLVGCGNSDKSDSASNASNTVAGKPDAAMQDRNRLLTELFSVRPPSVQSRNKPLAIAFRQAVISDDKVGSSADAYLKI